MIKDKIIDALLIFGVLMFLLFIARHSGGRADSVLITNALCGGSIFLWPAILTIKILRNTLRFNREFPQRIFRDVSLEQRPLMPELQLFEITLEWLGFVRIGELERQMPNRSDMTIWGYRSHDGLITAGLMYFDNTSAVEFTTLFLDQAILTTSCPIGLTLDLPMLRAITASADEGILLAYHKHQRAGTKMMQLHGYPVAIHSMADYLHCTRTSKQHLQAIMPMLSRRAWMRHGSKIYPLLWIALLSVLILILGGQLLVISIVMLLLLIPEIILSLQP